MPSGRTALVPGFMAGLAASHQRFGKLPWAALFEPAVYYAEEGFEIYPLLGALIDYRAGVLSRLPAARAVFTHPGAGRLYRTGDRFRQPELAVTLRRLAELGAQEMYSGLWAQRLVEAVTAQGGRMTMEDMRAYEALWPKPERGFYRGLEVVGPGAPGTGGSEVIAALARLEPHDLRGLGHYSESAEALYQLLTATRARHLERRSGGHHSDGVIAIDEEGNVAAVVHTINTDAWGTTGKGAVHMPYFRNPGIFEPSDFSEVTQGDFPPSLIEDVRARGIPIHSAMRRLATGHGYWIDAMIYRSGRRMGATTNNFNGHAQGY